MQTRHSDHDSNARAVPASNEFRASAGARSEPVALLHQYRGSSNALTARIQATHQCAGL
jgi:hypothetical protein